MKQLFFAFFLLPTILFSQVPISTHWDKTFGSTKNDIARAMVQTPDNGYLIAGLTQKPDRFDTDILLIKINQSGDLIWQKNIGEETLETAYDLQSTVDGNFILVGTTSTPNSGIDILVLNIDSLGEVIWKKKLGGQGNDTGRGVTILEDGNFLIVGSYVPSAVSPSHGYICKLDRSGNILWEQTYGGDHFPKKTREAFEIKFGFDAPSGEELNKVVATKDGGFMAVGNSLYHGKKRVATDLWLVKTDSKGKFLWDKALGGIGGDDGLDIFEKNDGTLIVVGEYYDKPKGRISLWVFNIDQEGAIIWDHLFNKLDFDESQDDLVDKKWFSDFDGGVAGFQSSTGHLLINGYHTQVDPNKQSLTNTCRDVWTLCLNGKGEVLWQHAFSEKEDDKSFSMIEDEYGNYVFAGFTCSKGNGLKDVWIRKFSISRP